MSKDGVELERLRIARDSLRHRGPDAAGEYQGNGIYLGFRRLKILDLTAHGDQPMKLQNEDVWIVFNGEIYNYVELRAELENSGHSFRSNADTEVLLRLYAELGEKMLARLNGMFAFAIYDKRRETLLLARDRLGKKPVFYWRTAGGLAFASELRALKLLPGFPTDVDPDAAGLFFRLGWVPGWSCIYAGVEKLPPGSWLRYDIESGRLEGPTGYWSLPEVETEQGLDENEWLERIEELLWDATRIRLRSDVPLGTFLSGGIDSALITAASMQNASNSLTAITVSFPGWEEDEWPLAAMTAKHVGVHAVHRELREDGAPLLAAVMGHFDEPFADSSALPTSLVCQAAREQMTVALSGDGGDEVFAGYENHVRAYRWRAIEHVPASLRRSLLASTAFLTRPDSRARRFLRRASEPIATLGLGAKLYPFEDWLDECISKEYVLSQIDVASRLRSHVIQWPGAFSLDQAQRIDLQLYLVDDILVKMDRMSMLHSLEVRSPFLDHRLIELALRIPPQLRVKRGRNKYLLRRLAERHVPKEVVVAPKRGFGIPLYEWLFESKYSAWFKETALAGPRAIVDPVKANGGRRLWELAETNRALAPALLRVLSFRWWLQASQEQV